MKHQTRRTLLQILSTAPLLATTQTTYLNIQDFGALPNSRALNTIAIQKAIDSATTSGGATVIIPAGRFLIGTLFLKSNVTLHLEPGATLLASPSIENYPTGTHRNMYANEPHMDRCLLFARDAENITIEGAGTIDGQGAQFPHPADPAHNRPMLLRFINCRHVSLRGITLLNPAAWTCAFLYSDNLHIDSVNISSRANSNGDGLDFDGCQNVRVSNCQLDNSDDSICLQCSDPAKPVRNVVITNCIMTSRWAAIRIGLLSRGAFSDITVSNCVFHDIEGEALKIQLAEGGAMDNLLFSNIVMRNVPRPVFLTFNSFPFRVDSPGPLPPMQSLRNVAFNDMQIECGNTSPDPRNSFFAVLGLPQHPIENVTFHNISFTAPGGGIKAEAERRNVPELANIRPERMPLGAVLPSYGIYARHVRNLTIGNLRLQTAATDLRPALLCDEVEHLTLTVSQLATAGNSPSAIVLRNTKDAFIQGCTVLVPSKTGPGKTEAFLRLEGRDSTAITLLGNDARHCNRLFDRAENASTDAVTEVGNL